MACRYKFPHLHQAAPSYAKEDLCIPLPAYHISAQAEPTKTISYAKAMVCRCPYLHQAVPSYAKEDLCIPLPAYHYFTYHYYFLNPYKPLSTN